MNVSRPSAALAFALLAAGLMSGGPAAAQSRAELDERLTRIERIVESQALTEIANQLAVLEAEVRALRGALEELEFGLDGARRQQRDQYVDLDRRLQAAEERAEQLAQSTATAASDPQAVYQVAFDLLKSGQYAAARQAFEAFLAAHPSHDLAANAQYWLGEAHYVERQYEAALAAFERVLTTYPQARKGPDALLKVGYCQYELQRFGAARATLTRVVQEYPGSEAAREAAQRLERMAAAGR